MPVAVEWYDETHTAIYMSLADPWTLAEYLDATRQSYRMMGEVDHMVDLIMDATATTGIPRNIFSHFATTTTEATIPANQGFVLVIVQGTLMQTFVSMAKRILPNVTRKMYMADSLHAALDKLVNLREAVV